MYFFDTLNQKFRKAQELFYLVILIWPEVTRSYTRFSGFMLPDQYQHGAHVEGVECLHFY